MQDKKNIKLTLGKRVALIRKDTMHMTKCEFAKLIGMKNQYLGAVEKGERGLTVEKVIKICQSCNISADYLLFGTENNIKENIKNEFGTYTEEEIDNSFEIMKKLLLLLK